VSNASDTRMSGGSIQTKRGLELDRVVLLGRTFEEYRRYFLLEPDHLIGKRVLDVAGGVSSFCAEANNLGINVTSFDPIYSLSPEKIMERSEPDLEAVYRAIGKWADVPLGLLQKSRLHAQIAQARVHDVSLRLRNSSGALCSGRAAETTVCRL